MNPNLSDENARTGANGGGMHKIEKRVTLRAPRSRVWNALTDVSKFCQWFGIEKTDGVFAPGARLHMVASEIDGGDFDMFIEQMQPEHLFSWRWHPGARDAALNYDVEPTTLVVFNIEDAPGGTLLTITETGFDRISLARRARVFDENSHGWDFQLERLERYVNQAS